ncbi:Xylose transport system permease protein xylH [Raoultella terrigena]|uniref:Xylose transport system permease protein xylH n=1 Tax=Raoultella terrigena TaxID=577 RepID=A0A4U9DEW2_RAOTE|nr:Xylose transport system permease protein xylH [Raoultella terrigena]
MLALWLVAWLITERTLFGKYVRAIGQNGEAARIAGIRDRLTMLWVLVAASAMCAIGGVILSANLRQFTPLAGQSYLMDAIAAVFIGTAFNRQGRASIAVPSAGCCFLAIIDNGLNLMGLNYLSKTRWWALFWWSRWPSLSGRRVCVSSIVNGVSMAAFDAVFCRPDDP